MPKVTYKIDRLSNNSLEFGLKTGATIGWNGTVLEAGKLLRYTAAPTISNDLDITDKKYVDDQISTLNTSLLATLDAHMVQGYGLTIGSASASHTRTIGLAGDQLGRSADTIVGYGTGRTYYGYNGSGTNNDASTDTKSVISGLKVDQYGRVLGVYTKQVSSSDLEINAADIDNYKQWGVQIGSGTGSSTNTILVESAWLKGDNGYATTYANNLVLLGGSGINITKGTGKDITFSANLATGGPIISDGGALTLQSIHSTVPSDVGFYKIKVDAYGRVAAFQAFSLSDITTDFAKFDGTHDGIVAAKGSTNINDSGTTGTYFLASDAKWTKIAWDNVTVATDTNKVYLTGSASTSGLSTLKVNSTVYMSGGTLTASAFSGNGASLTSLNASNISTGTINKDRLPMDDIKTALHGNLTANQVVLTSTNNTISGLANVTPASGKYNVLTIESTNTTPHWKDLSDMVGSYISGEGGMVFKGVLNKDATASTGVYKTLPTEFQKGWFLRVASAGSYTINGASVNLEVGDGVYAVTDSTSTDTIKWAVLQTNIDNAVTYSSATATSGVLAIKTASETIIKDSGINATLSGSTWSLSTDVTGNAATATKLASKVKIFGNDFDGSSAISGKLTGVTGIEVSGTTSYIGTAGSPFVNAYITTVHGNLDGNATSANKVNKALTITLDTDSASKTFDGSTAQEVVINAANTGFAKTANITVGTPTGSGNAIVGFGTTTSNATTGTVTISPTKGYLVDTVESSILATSVSNNKATIGWKTTATAGTFDTSNSNPTGTTRLNYSGNLYATQLFSGGTLVDTEKSGTAGSKLLVSTAGSTGHYTYKESDYTVVSSVTATTTGLPTAQAVKSYVDSAVTGLDNKTLKVVSGSWSGSTVVQAPQIASGAIIDRIEVYVEDAYSKAVSSFKIELGTLTEVSKNSADCPILVDDAEGEGTYTYKISRKSTTAITPTVSVSPGSGSTGGAGQFYVYYI